MNRKVVLSGGPGVGKTSIIQYLRSLNYEFREEIFTQIFAEAESEGKLNEEFLRSEKLLHDLVQAQQKLEAKESKTDLIFLDRCRIDILGFAANLNIKPTQKDLKWLIQNEYDLFFIVEPLPEKFYDQNAVRRQSQKESLEHHEKIIQHYSDFIKNNHLDLEKCLIRVPFFKGERQESVQKRAQFILSEIQKRLPKVRS